MAPDALTERERYVVQLITDSVRVRGYPPSVREVGAALGLVSPSTVHQILRNMTDRGILAVDADTPRGIRVLVPVAHCATCRCHEPHAATL